MRYLLILLCAALALAGAAAHAADIALLPHVPDNATLSATKSTAYDYLVRDDFSIGFGAPPLTYKASALACSLNAGAGDGGSQVPSADGKCWLANIDMGRANMLIWGADPTGVRDSSAAVTAAYNVAAAGGGGTLYFGPGKYKINTPPVITASGVSIVCAGSTATVLQANFASGDFISFGTFAASLGSEMGIYGCSLQPLQNISSGAMVHVAGTSLIHIEDVFIDQDGSGHKGFVGIQIDNYGSQGHVWLKDVIAQNVSNACVDIGEDSTAAVTEVHVVGTMVLARCGTNGVQIDSVSGFYGGPISIYLAGNAGVLFDPANGVTKHGVGPFNQAIYGIDLHEVNADTSTGSGFLFAATGIISEVKCKGCLSGSTQGTAALDLEAGTMNDISFPNFKASLSSLHGVALNTTTISNFSLINADICDNNQSNNAAGTGLLVNAAITGGLNISNNVSGSCGFGAALGNANPQKWGYFFVAGVNHYVFAGNRSPGNVTDLTNNSSGAADAACFPSGCTTVTH